LRIRTRVAAVAVAASTAGLLTAFSGGAMAATCGSPSQASGNTTQVPGTDAGVFASGGAGGGAVGVESSNTTQGGYIQVSGTPGAPPSGDITASGTSSTTPANGTVAAGSDASGGTVPGTCGD